MYVLGPPGSQSALLYGRLDLQVLKRLLYWAQFGTSKFQCDVLYTGLYVGPVGACGDPGGTLRAPNSGAGVAYFQKGFGVIGSPG